MVGLHACICIVESFCHRQVIFSHVESYSVKFEGSQKCPMDKVKFLLFQDVEAKMFSHFATPIENCPVCASAFPLQLKTV